MSNIVSAGIYPHPPIMIPEVGKGDTDKVKATTEAVELLARRLSASGADMLLVISPHGPVFRNSVALLGEKKVTGSFVQFGAPGVKLTFSNDLSVVEGIRQEAKDAGLPVTLVDKQLALSYGYEFGLDHGALVPLYFLHKAGITLPLVHLTFGLLSPRELFEFGRSVNVALSKLQRKAAIVASGDLSHRLTKDAPAGFSSAGKEFDEHLIQLLSDYDVPSILNLSPDLVEKAGECGYRSILICLGMLDGWKLNPELLSYESPFGVGYLAMDLTNKGSKDERVNVEDKGKESEHVRLAREALETYVRTGKVIDVPVDSLLKEHQAGVFVSLKSAGNLRGCIGTIEPVQTNLADEIVENAISAGVYDPRFPAVTEHELGNLTYSVDVLSEPQEAAGLDELDPVKYGIIVKSGNKSGVLLPDLEGVNTVDDQLKIVLQKAGIRAEDKYRIFTFTVTRYR